MKSKNIFLEKIVSSLQKHTKGFLPPMSHIVVQEFGKDPFLILISCLLSLRSRDDRTLPICQKLFKQAQTPQELLAIPLSQLEKMLFSIGFYRKKAALLHEVCQFLLEHFAGEVPSSREQLLSIPGVGRKTANLVLAEGFDIPAICVDIHVHRISNRLGIIATKTPEQTEQALMKILPKELWRHWNGWLVTWGQNICTPVSPKCSQCALLAYCQQVGVTKHR